MIKAYFTTVIQLCSTTISKVDKMKNGFIGKNT